MLTAFDKLWCTVFTVALVGAMAVGGCLPIVYLIPPGELPAPGRNYTFGQAMLCLGGMALGFAASLTVFGFLSRRFVSAATHQRWAAAMDDSRYIRYRAPGLGKLIRWALIPAGHEAAPADGMRSNNRWRGP